MNRFEKEAMVKSAYRALVKMAKGNALMNILGGDYARGSDNKLHWFNPDQMKSNGTYGTYMPSRENYGMDNVSRPYPPSYQPATIIPSMESAYKERNRLNDQLRRYWEQKAKEGYRPVK